MAAEGGHRVVGKLSTKQEGVRQFSHTVASQDAGYDYSSLIMCQKKLQSDINKCLTELIEHANSGKASAVERRADMPKGSDEDEDEEDEEDKPENGTIKMNSTAEEVFTEPKYKLQRTEGIS